MSVELALASTDTPERARQIQRLKQFIIFDAPMNVVAAIVLLVIYALFPWPMLPWLTGMVLCNAALLAWAYGRANHGQLEAAVIGVVAGLWVIILIISFVVPVVWAIMLSINALGVVVALPFLQPKTMRWVLLAAAIVALLSSIGYVTRDTSDILAVVPQWVISWLNAIFGPGVLAAVFLMLWQYSSRLHDTLQKTQAANAALQESERSLEAKVNERTAALQTINRDLTESQAELARARDAALEATRAKSAFLASMSHEIRTPMNAVIGMTGLLLDTPLNPQQHDFAETIRNSGDALLTIINDILDFSKIEANKLELESHPFDVRDCVESALELLALKAEDKGLELACLIEPEVPSALLGDVTRLRQIIVNLLGNALKFTERGEVVVTVKLVEVSALPITMPNAASLPALFTPRHYTMLFAVRDTGIGIPPERIERLFQSFSQVDASTTRKYGGTGLGLAISKRLSELMGGTMWVESARAGQGATFFFTIQGTSSPPLTPEAALLEQAQLTGKRVLIVDDNATNREILELQTTAWQMLPQATSSPHEALALVEGGGQFDLVLLDMQMPDMDGLMLAEAIRTHHHGRQLPLVMLTSLGRREAGANPLHFAAFLTKPVRASQLYNTLVNVFAKEPQQLKPGYRATGPVFDPELGKRHPLRILLAEDNSINQKLALTMLDKLGYRADVAGNGLEVLEAVERQHYDVILMDVQMPEMDGLEATRHLNRQFPNGVRPRIIAMTANAMQGDREICLAAGMDDYLSKPIRPETLIEALAVSQPIKLALRPTTGPLVTAQPPTSAPVASLSPTTLDMNILYALRDEMDVDFVLEILGDFALAAPKQVAAIRASFNAGDVADVSLRAHTLKSNSGTLGALALAEACKVLEQHTRAGQLGDAARIMVEDLEAAYASASQALAEARARL